MFVPLVVKSLDLWLLHISSSRSGVTLINLCVVRSRVIYRMKIVLPNSILFAIATCLPTLVGIIGSLVFFSCRTSL